MSALSFEFADHGPPYPRDGCGCEVCHKWRVYNGGRLPFLSVQDDGALHLRRQPSPTIGEEATLDLLFDIFHPRRGA